MKTLKTKLPASIKTIGKAENFLTELFNNGESYHPEDLAADCLPFITNIEADHLDNLMCDIYNLEGNDGRHTNLVFDPCEFLLSIDTYYQTIINED